MREPPTRLLDELSRVMTGAVGLAQGVQREADSFARSQIERILRDADIVTREEFEVVRLMAMAARDENERLLARIVALEEAAIIGQSGAEASKQASRPAPRKSGRESTGD